MKKIKTNVALKDLCTIGVGGEAKFYLEIRDIATMREALRWCHSRNTRFLILGRGSNLIFDDRGFNGLIIHNKIDFLEELSSISFRVGAGFSFAHLGTLLSKKSLSGLEFAAGIPASVGGAIFMNAGVGDRQTFDTLEKVEFMDMDGKIRTFKKDELLYGYRFSSFQNMTGAIIAATFSLRHSTDAWENQQKLLAKRLKSQPYADKSAGCVFRNSPNFKAGALIAQCGLKNLQEGGARVSPIHANFIINAHKASSRDILTLIAKIRERVKEKNGYDLQMEVKYIPYDL